MRHSQKIADVKIICERILVSEVLGTTSQVNPGVRFTSVHHHFNDTASRSVFVLGVGALSLAALDSSNFTFLDSFCFDCLRDVPAVGLEDGQEIILRHILGEAITCHDSGVDPSAPVRALRVWRELLEHAAIRRWFIATAPKKLANAREFNTQPLIDASSDRFVQR